MRISTANAFDNGIDTLSRRQAEMTALQDQITSGKRISRASDDPAAAARAERATGEHRPHRDEPARGRGEQGRR